jgi:hypothetical protein
MNDQRRALGIGHRFDSEQRSGKGGEEQQYDDFLHDGHSISPEQALV